MDTTRPISYRGIDLNDASLGPGLANIKGIAIESADYSAVLGHGYIEKRSQQDGYDAGDVFLGKRDLSLQGTVYGESRADLFDRLAQVRAAFTPSGAYASDPSSYGYLPLLFEELTLKTEDFPDGYILKQMYVRPRSTPSFVISRDAIGGNDVGGLAIPFQQLLEARDPRIYSQVPSYQNFPAGPTSGSFDFTNRGNYPAPLNISLYAPGGAAAYDLTLTGFGTIMVLKMPESQSDRYLFYDGIERYVTLQEDGLTTLRMDLIEFLSDTPHPQVPPGDSSMTWSQTDGVSRSDSTIGFREAWA